MAENKTEAKGKKEQKPEVVKEKKKKKGGGVGCLVVLIVILITPILVMVGMYFLNHDFELFANRVLSVLPGGIGEHFGSKPTRADELRDVKEAADFLMRLDDDRIIDKLKLVKKEDARFYDDLIKEMLRLNPNRTRALLETIRRADDEQGILDAIMGDIEEEKKQETQNFVEYLNSLSIDEAVEELEKICKEYGGVKRAATYISMMEEGRASRIIYKLSNENKNQIFAMLEEAKANRIRASYMQEQRKNNELEQLASIMKREKGSVIAAELEKHDDDDKVLLLRKLGPRVAGLALAHMGDSEKALKLVTMIKNAELSEKGVDEVTADIVKALKIYRDFDDNVRELVDVYLKIDTGKVSQVISDMMINSGPDRVYRLTNGDIVEISDVDLVTEILRRFPEKQLAEILSRLDATLAAELTRRLALPK